MANPPTTNVLNLGVFIGFPNIYTPKEVDYLFYMIMDITSLWFRVGTPNSQSINNYIYCLILHEGSNIGKVTKLCKLLHLIKYNISQENMKVFLPLLQKMINYSDSKLIIDIIKTCRTVINLEPIPMGVPNLNVYYPNKWTKNQCIQCRKLIIQIIIKYPALGITLQSNLKKQGQSLYELSEIVP